MTGGVSRCHIELMGKGKWAALGSSPAQVQENFTGIDLTWLRSWAPDCFESVLASHITDSYLPPSHLHIFMPIFKNRFPQCSEMP